MKARFIDSINSIEPNRWNHLAGTDYPFLRHEFLAALENSGSTTQKTGWQPHHCLIEESGTLVGLMPLYIKHHSYGEYVFDWAWADAYHRNGLEYYPKLLNAIPFTPASGPRMACLPGREQDIYAFIYKALLDYTHEHFSSAHSLFTPQSDSPPGWMLRTGCQFHWHNRNYRDFEHFLESFTSRKRKNLKKERRAVNEDIDFTVKNGRELSQDDWQRFTAFYQTTYLKRSGHHGYLTPSFFPLLASLMGEQLVMIQAHKNGDWIAGALCFKDSQTLYGRYWGCLEDYPNLHFETCYYQGIEYAIANGLRRFDPGAQGEHKIQRGFEPTITYSHHYIAQTEFQIAIEQFLSQEREGITQYYEDAKHYLPFKEADQQN